MVQLGCYPPTQSETASHENFDSAPLAATKNLPSVIAEYSAHNTYTETPNFATTESGKECPNTSTQSVKIVYY